MSVREKLHFKSGDDSIEMEPKFYSPNGLTCDFWTAYPDLEPVMVTSPEDARKEVARKLRALADVVEGVKS